MESLLFGYYDPFTGSLIIQVITVGLFSVCASFRYWRKKLTSFFCGPSQKDENNHE
ncbi:MAG: hypothetical protein Q4G69_05675 [Planctomycetia bacterium]|nr:hypothetical protein [Planctomycetia bacterium]